MAKRKAAPKKKATTIGGRKKAGLEVNATIEESFEDEESLFFKYNFSKAVSQQENSKRR